MSALRQLLEPLGSRILLLGAHFICPRVTEYEPRIAVGLHHQGEPMNTLLDPIVNWTLVAAVSAVPTRVRIRNRRYACRYWNAACRGAISSLPHLTALPVL